MYYYHIKYNGYAALESREDNLEKEREKKEIQYDIFSEFIAGLSETAEMLVDFNEKLFHRLVTSQRSIRTAGWYSHSATEWKSARRYKTESGQGIGFVSDASDHFFGAWKDAG